MIIFVAESINRPSLRNIGKKMFSLHTLWKRRAGLELQTQSFLTTALDSSEWLASYPGPFTLWDWVPIHPWIGGWVSPLAGLEVLGKRKTFPLPGSERRSSSPYPGHYTDYAIPASQIWNKLKEMPRFLLVQQCTRRKHRSHGNIAIWLSFQQRLGKSKNTIKKIHT